MNRSRIAKALQLGFTLVLVGLIFTNAFSFLVGDPTLTNYGAGAHPNFEPFRQLGIPPYSIRLASTVVAGLLIILQSTFAPRLIQKPIFWWTFAATMFFSWGMLVRVFNMPAGLPEHDLLEPFWSQVSSLVFLLSCLVVLDGSDILYFAKRWIAYATVFGTALNLYELFNPGTFSNVTGRAAGLYVNSNGSGMALVLGCLIGLPTIPRRWRETFALCTLAGVLATISRTAVASMFVLLVAATLGHVLSRRRLLIGAMLCITLFLAVNIKQILVQENIAGNWSRLTSQDDSSRDRLRLVRKTLEEFEAAPLLGQGFGTDEYWNDEPAHNLYVKLMADEGILGVLLLPALALSVRRRSWDFYAFAIVFLLWCFFDHFVFLDPFAMMCVAIEAVEASENKRSALSWDVQQGRGWRPWPTVSRL